jgi:lysophospholipase L1-like esterase
MKIMIVSGNLLRIPVLLIIVVMLAFSQNSNAQSQLRVLPLGNSITRGSMCLNGDIYDCTEGLQDSKAIGYRNRLYNLLSNSGYYVDFVGGNKYGYTIMSDSDNAGFSGIKDQQLADIMESGTADSPWGQVTPGPYLDYYPADIVLLEIGTNDVLALEHNDVSNVSRLLDAIDDYEVASGRPVLVFLAKIISPANYTCNSHVNTATYNSKLYTMAQNRISNGDKIVWVDLHCGAGINYYTDMVDQVHPNQTGYDKMADKWFAVIDAYNTAPVVSQIPNQVISHGGSFAQINLDNYVSDAEDSPQDIIWSVSPSFPVHFNVTIDENRRVTVTPKDAEWSGYEDIVFVAMDRGKVVSGLQKTDNCMTRFTVDWLPEIIGQQDLTISEGQSLNITLDKLIITDPENAPAGLYVVVSPGSNYSVNGTSITPQQDFFGQLTVPVKVVDGGTESNTYPLLVDVVRVNFPPVITSTPVLIAYTNGLYQYNVTATDPDPENVLSYSAPQKPAWMQINGSTGLLSGIPARGEEGFHDVTVRVTDGNSVDDQSFTVEVILQNQAPVITTLPEITATAGETYTYGILATDADNDPLFYFNSTLPEWLEFIAAAQVAIGIPSNSDTGENLVILGVTDQIDTTYQAFMIDVSFTSGYMEAEFGLNHLIYPNPVHDHVVIDLAHLYNPGDGVSFQLFDMTGKKVMQRELTGPVTEISLLSQELSAGIYTYQLGFQSAENRIITGKLIIR